MIRLSNVVWVHCWSKCYRNDWCCNNHGTGNYVFNETLSGGVARVKVWDASSNTLDINMLSAMEFPVGGKIVGQESGVTYIIKSVMTHPDFPNDDLYRQINTMITQSLR